MIKALGRLEKRVDWFLGAGVEDMKTWLEENYSCGITDGKEYCLEKHITAFSKDGKNVKFVFALKGISGIEYAMAMEPEKPMKTFQPDELQEFKDHIRSLNLVHKATMTQTMRI